MQPAHQRDRVRERAIDEPIRSRDRMADRRLQIVRMNDVLVQPQGAHHIHWNHAVGDLDHGVR